MSGAAQQAATARIVPPAEETAARGRELAARVALLSPKPGDTIVAWAPDGPFADDRGAEVDIVHFLLELLHPLGKEYRCRDIVLPAGFDVKAHDGTALTYQGAEEAARVLREEADAIEAGR